MSVCLPPQYDNDDCNGHLLKDGDTQNVSVVQFGLLFLLYRNLVLVNPPSLVTLVVFGFSHSCLFAVKEK